MPVRTNIPAVELLLIKGWGGAAASHHARCIHSVPSDGGTLVPCLFVCLFVFFAT